MSLPVRKPGETIVVEERWHDLLWSAVPHRVVESGPKQLISYVPAGTLATRATSRDLPGTENLTRDERKKYTLRTRHARVAEIPEAPTKLFFHRPGHWSRTNLGWDPITGDFRGWYVNFELPPQPTDLGLVSMDLVLDLWINPDRTWSWKDRDDYVELLNDATLDPSITDGIAAETATVVHELETHTGPFAPHWQHFTADPTWAIPELPASHTAHGSAWSFPAMP